MQVRMKKVFVLCTVVLYVFITNAGSESSNSEESFKDNTYGVISEKCYSTSLAVELLHMRRELQSQISMSEERLTEKTHAIKETVTDNTNQIDSVEEATSKLESKTRGLDERVVDLERMSDETSNKSGELENQAESTSARVAKIETEVGKLVDICQELVSTGRAQLIAIDELNRTQIEILTGINELYRKQSEQTTAINELKNTQREQTTVINELNRTQIELSSTVDELNRTQMGLSSTVEELNRTQMRFLSTIDELNRSQIELSSTVDELHHTQMGLSSTVNELNRTQIEQTDTINELQLTQIELGDNVTGIRNAMTASDTYIQKHVCRDRSVVLPGNCVDGDCCLKEAFNDVDTNLGCAKGYIRLRSSSVCYKIHYECKTWDDARKTCQEEGTELLMLKENLYNTFLPILEAAERKTSCGTYFLMWLGGSDITSEGKWTWMDGTTVDARYWDPEGKEPNGGKGENCLNALGQERKYLFNDLACSRKIIYACAHT